MFFLKKVLIKYNSKNPKGEFSLKTFIALLVSGVGASMGVHVPYWVEKFSDCVLGLWKWFYNGNTDNLLWQPPPAHALHPYADMSTCLSERRLQTWCNAHVFSP